MKIPRWVSGVAAALTLALILPNRLSAQGITTGAISGTVTNEQGQGIDAAQIRVTNRATGASAGTLTRGDGRFYIQGLETGGPYTVSVRHIGFAPQEQGGLTVSLGQNLRVDFKLVPQATQLQALQVTATAENSVISQSHTGVGTTISDSTIRRLPSLNRDFTDFARLTPQVSTSGNGISGGGVNNRFNNIQIDGTSNADLFGLSSTPTPGGLSGAKTISLEAVKEYQVLLSPFDIRQGGFTGLLVNAVTKSGTNDRHGSAFYYFRDQSITRDQPYLNDFRQAQYGFSVGGPIIKDKAFFFVAPEWQAQKQPSSGPYIGSSDAPVTAANITAFNDTLNAFGINGGSGATLPRKNPNTNIFARLDFNLPFNSRLALRHNYVDAAQDVFGGGGSRDTPGASAPTFALTSNKYSIANKTNSTVGQLFTNFTNGVYNELLVGYTDISDIRSVPVVSPEITVSVPRFNGSGVTNLVAGTERSSQGNELAQKILEITDNVTIPVGTHAITIGTRNQIYQPDNLFAQNRYGTWSFSSLDSLHDGLARTYLVAVPVVNGTPTPGANTRAKFKAGTLGGYIQDQWQATPNLSITGGLRVDIPKFFDKPAFNQTFFTQFNRRTDELPSNKPQWSPRLGVNWDVTGDQRNQVRGGIGLFAGPPAYVWLSNAYGNTAVFGYASLNCNGNPGSPLAPPVFNSANAASPPVACGGGATAALGAAVNTIRDDFRFPQDMKVSAGYDHRFVGGMLDGLTATVEGLYSRAIYSPFYENIALTGPQGTDPHGRTMYGTLSAGTGNAVALKVAQRNQVFDLTNSSGDYSYNLSTNLSKRFSRALEGMVGYTYSQARDVQSVLNSTAASNWGQGRSVKGDITAHDLARSKWEQPHRVVATGTYTFPTKTDISLFYEGASGAPYDFAYNGDLNSDGRSGNDLVYIPKNVFDPAEIQFASTSTATIQQQQQAFDKFIKEEKCLNSQRGTIMSRNSCRAPWNNMVNVAARQSLTTLRGENVSLQLDVFNFTNLLNRNWGLQRIAVQPGLPNIFLLSRTGTLNPGTLNAQPIVTFNTSTTHYNSQSATSNYRMQLSLRYSF